MEHSVPWICDKWKIMRQPIRAICPLAHLVHGSLWDWARIHTGRGNSKTSYFQICTIAFGLVGVRSRPLQNIPQILVLNMYLHLSGSRVHSLKVQNIRSEIT